MNSSRYDAAMSRRRLLGQLTAGFASYFGLTAFVGFGRNRAAGPKWDDNFELAVTFDIAQPEEGRYHRPYVAVWVEDASGLAVRTLSIWLNRTGRGPRYFKELRRWFNLEESSRGGGGPDLVSTISSATRLPGNYTVTWNGRDDQGRVVEQGTYRVFIEAAREHGSYQLMQQELQLGTESKSADLSGNREIARARIEYRRRK
ncbi:MAG: DUF2271 domain-containing protein [Gemmatimonadaceae bacterium]